MLHRFAFMGLLMVAVLVAPKAKAGQAELLYFFSELCEYCELWDEEVGTSYGLTQEAKILPLRPVDLDKDLPADLAHIDNVVYTPTFIVYRDGKEVGRLVGYNGPDFFWGYLSPLLKKVQGIAASAQASTAAGACTTC